MLQMYLGAAKQSTIIIIVDFSTHRSWMCCMIDEAATTKNKKEIKHSFFKTTLTF